MATASAPSIVVVGAGMAGLSAARALADSGMHVTVIDEHNYSTFPPMLFYVSTAFLGPEDVVRPVRALLPRHHHVEFQLGRATAIDPTARRVLLDDGRAIGFDYLVLAPGVVPAFGAVPGAANHAIPMKTVLDAVRLRNSLIRSFELAAAHPAHADRGLTSVAVVGGGATGVEVAGYLSDFLFRYSFAHDYPQLSRDRIRVCLIEAGERLLPGLHPKLSRYALEHLRRNGVDVRLDTKVAHIDDAGLTLVSGEHIPAATVVWGGGVAAAPWVSRLGVPLQAGRIVVESDLRVRGYDHIFAVGDAASVSSRGGQVYPQVAQVALQSGRHAARQIRRLSTSQHTTGFRYRDKGSMAMVGRNAAIVQAGPIRLTGRLAWIAWGVLHLAYLPGLVNRLSAGQKFLLWHLTHDTNARILLEREDSTSPPAAVADRMADSASADASTDVAQASGGSGGH